MDESGLLTVERAVELARELLVDCRLRPREAEALELLIACAESLPKPLSASEPRDSRQLTLLDFGPEGGR